MVVIMVDLFDFNIKWVALCRACQLRARATAARVLIRRRAALGRWLEKIAPLLDESPVILAANKFDLLPKGTARIAASAPLTHARTHAHAWSGVGPQRVRAWLKREVADLGMVTSRSTPPPL